MFEQRTFLDDVKAGQFFSGQVVVKTCKTRAGSKGPMVGGYVGDSSADVKLIMWEASPEDISALTEEEVVHVGGKMSIYEGKPQLVCETVQKISDVQTIRWAELLKRCARDAAEMHNELVKNVQTHMSDSGFRAAVIDLVSTPAFKMSPAASGLHHAYLSGLLEHTLGVVEHAIRMTPPTMSKEFVVAGAALHDIGKTQEYAMTGKVREVSGTLGHALIGCRMFHYAAAKHTLGSDIEDRAAHIIASHHGRREWGAVVEPQTVEAWIVHFADMLDAKMFIEAKEKRS